MRSTIHTLSRNPLAYGKRLAKVARIARSGSLPFVTTYPPGHFYSPIPDGGRRDERPCSSPRLADGLPASIDLNDEAQRRLLTSFSSFYGEMPIPVKKDAAFRTYLDNEYFSFGDSIVLYSMLRHVRPRRIVEVGSGYSSALMLDICDRFAMVDTKLTFIDPFPARLEGLLSRQDGARCTVIAERIQHVDLQTFSELTDNDILFIDSSHVAKYQSDLLHIVFAIMPLLEKGVIVHFHDIPWPFEYPDRWFEAGRAWNEAYFMRAFLSGSQDFEIIYFNSYMAQQHPELLRTAMPLAMRESSFPLTISNSSLWLRKRGGADRKGAAD